MKKNDPTAPPKLVNGLIPFHETVNPLVAGGILGIAQEVAALMHPIPRYPAGLNGYERIHHLSPDSEEYQKFHRLYNGWAMECSRANEQREMTANKIYSRLHSYAPALLVAIGVTVGALDKEDGDSGIAS